MIVRAIWALWFCFFAVTMPVPALRGQTAADTSISQVSPGVILESIDKHLEAEKAGLQPGDLVLSWSRGAAKGEIESPFDLWILDIDQGPRGPVVLKGRRGMEERTWTMGPDEWGIHARPNFSGPLLSVYREGDESKRSGKFDHAMECWHKAIALARESHAPGWLETWFLLRIAATFRHNEQWKEADQAFQAAGLQAEKIDFTVAANVFYSWYFTFRQRSDWDGAKKCIQQAIIYSEKTRFETLTAALLDRYSFILSMRNEITGEHEKMLQRARGIQERSIPNSLPLADTLTNLGVLAAETDLAKAEEYQFQAYAIYKKLEPESDDLATSLNNLADNAERRGKLALAEQYARQALRIEEKLSPDSRLTAIILFTLELVTKDRGDYAKSEQYLLHALAIARKLSSEDVLVIGALTNLCSTALAEDDLSKAESYCQQAHEMLERHPDQLDLAANFVALGDVAYRRGELDKAEQYYRQALPLNEKIGAGSSDLSSTMNLLGNVARRRGDLNQAEEWYRKALAAQEKVESETSTQAHYLANLAGVLGKKQQLDTAAQLYVQALNTLDHQMLNLGGTEDERILFRAQQADIYSAYIDLLMARGQQELALETMERSRTRTLLETLAQAHIDIHKGADPELLKQERSLQESLHAKSEQRIQLMGAKESTAQTAALETEISQLQAQYQEVESQLRLSSPSYAALTQPKPLSVRELQHLLDKDTVLLEYSLGEERSFVWAVTPGSIVAHELPKESEIDSAARRVYELLIERKHRVKGETPSEREARWAKSDTEYHRAAAALSRMVLQREAANLQDKRVVVVPDGALEYIPFAALPDPGARLPKQPLVVQHEIVTLPSASVLAVLRRQQQGREPAPHAVAVLADPVFDAGDPRVSRRQAKFPAEEATRGTEQEQEEEEEYSPDERSLTRSLSDVTGETRLTRLLYSRQEALAILAEAPKAKELRALDFRASRTTALNPNLSNYRIVHFATHGLLDSQHPELSGLVLSLVDEHGQREDGFLTLQDVYNLDLHADLVVLSACQTALGKQIKGEGLVGLTRGFMHAGATRVLASLWSVSDVATAKLMGRFYAEVMRNGSTPTSALRKAQIWMWTQSRWSSPYYWAGFQLQGEWQ